VDDLDRVVRISRIHEPLNPRGVVEYFDVAPEAVYALRSAGDMNASLLPIGTVGEDPVVGASNL